jgi:hypothetical protein
MFSCVALRSASHWCVHVISLVQIFKMKQTRRRICVAESDELPYRDSVSAELWYWDFGGGSAQRLTGFVPGWVSRMSG